MKLTITTLVIVEDIHDPQCDEMNICYHSFKEDPEEAKSELISEVNASYAPSIVFNSIEEIKEYFEYVHLESQEITLKDNNMEPIITVNEYPIGWEWLDKVPLEDFTWLIEIFSTMTDDICTYDFATFDKEATDGEPPYPVIEIHRRGLAYFMYENQGYRSGISMYGHYIACKSLDISSEKEYMNQLTNIKLICNEL